MSKNSPGNAREPAKPAISAAEKVTDLAATAIQVLETTEAGERTLTSVAREKTRMTALYMTIEEQIPMGQRLVDEETLVRS